MTNRLLRTVGAVGLLIALAGVLMMLSLDRPLALAGGDELGQTAPPGRCPECTWEYAYEETLPGETVLLVPGSGTFHGVWVGTGTLQGYAHFWDGPPEEDQSNRIIVINMPETHNQFFILDVEFQNGLYHTGSRTVVTVLYH